MASSEGVRLDELGAEEQGEMRCSETRFAWRSARSRPGFCLQAEGPGAWRLPGFSASTEAARPNDKANAAPQRFHGTKNERIGRFAKAPVAGHVARLVTAKRGRDKRRSRACRSGAVDGLGSKGLAKSDFEVSVRGRPRLEGRRAPVGLA